MRTSGNMRIYFFFSRLPNERKQDTLHSSFIINTRFLYEIVPEQRNIVAITYIQHGISWLLCLVCLFSSSFFFVYYSFKISFLYRSFVLGMQLFAHESLSYHFACYHRYSKTKNKKNASKTNIGNSNKQERKIINCPIFIVIREQERFISTTNHIHGTARSTEGIVIIMNNRILKFLSFHVFLHTQRTGKFMTSCRLKRKQFYVQCRKIVYRRSICKHASVYKLKTLIFPNVMTSR